MTPHVHRAHQKGTYLSNKIEHDNKHDKLGLSSAKLRNSQFSALTLLESQKGLVVLLAALSMTISNIFFEGGGARGLASQNLYFC